MKKKIKKFAFGGSLRKAIDKTVLNLKNKEALNLKNKEASDLNKAYSVNDVPVVQAIIPVNNDTVNNSKRKRSFGGIFGRRFGSSNNRVVSPFGKVNSRPRSPFGVGRLIGLDEGMKKGGAVKKKTVSKAKTSSASKRADGCITKGKTKGKMV